MQLMHPSFFPVATAEAEQAPDVQTEGAVAAHPAGMTDSQGAVQGGKRPHSVAVEEAESEGEVCSPSPVAVLDFGDDDAENEVAERESNLAPFEARSAAARVQELSPSARGASALAARRTHGVFATPPPLPRKAATPSTPGPNDQDGLTVLHDRADDAALAEQCQTQDDVVGETATRGGPTRSTSLPLVLRKPPQSWCAPPATPPSRKAGGAGDVCPVAEQGPSNLGDDFGSPPAEGRRGANGGMVGVQTPSPEYRQSYSQNGDALTPIGEGQTPAQMAAAHAARAAHIAHTAAVGAAVGSTQTMLRQSPTMTPTGRPFLYALAAAVTPAQGGYGGPSPTHVVPMIPSPGFQLPRMGAHVVTPTMQFYAQSSPNMRHPFGAAHGLTPGGPTRPQEGATVAAPAAGIAAGSPSALPPPLPVTGDCTGTGLLPAMGGCRGTGPSCMW